MTDRDDGDLFAKTKKRNARLDGPGAKLSQSLTPLMPLMPLPDSADLQERFEEVRGPNELAPDSPLATLRLDHDQKVIAAFDGFNESRKGFNQARLDFLRSDSAADGDSDGLSVAFEQARNRLEQASQSIHDWSRNEREILTAIKLQRKDARKDMLAAATESKRKDAALWYGPWTMSEAAKELLRKEPLLRAEVKLVGKQIDATRSELDKLRAPARATSDGDSDTSVILFAPMKSPNEALKPPLRPSAESLNEAPELPPLPFDARERIAQGIATTPSKWLDPAIHRKLDAESPYPQYAPPRTPTPEGHEQSSSRKRSPLRR